MRGSEDGGRGLVGEEKRGIAQWPDELILGMRDLGRESKPLPNERLRVLATAAGLIGPDEAWTPFGASVLDLFVHEYWVENDELRTWLEEYSAANPGAVLDVGCSTGGVLRGLRSATRRVGLDIDAIAIALANRLAAAEGQQIEFQLGTGEKLPFEDGSFDCVVCRNALTYMHQATVLAELSRVLRTNGLLVLRFENFFYDLRAITRRMTFRRGVCRLRDFAYGLVHAATGLQPRGRASFLPGRTFGVLARIRSRLAAASVRVERVAEANECPRFLGRATQTSLAARKG